MAYRPIYRITPHLLKRIVEISELHAILQRFLIQVSGLPVLQREARARATHSSTAIEGNPLTLLQVEAIARGKVISVPWRAEREVRNYLQALQWIEKHPKTKITEASLRKLHRVMMRDLFSVERCGKYKDKQNFVVNENGIKIYTPPSPGETPKLTRELVRWLYEKEARETHSIIVSAIAHHRLVSIHPFSDGNGRVARAVGTWILYQMGFDAEHVLYLDEYFEADRKRYYLKIQQARELDDDLTHWLEYVAEGILWILGKVKKRIDDLQISSRVRIRLSHRQEDLLAILRDRPVCGTRELQKELNLTRARIHQLLSPLVEAGLVVPEGQTRATVYRLAG